MGSCGDSRYSHCHALRLASSFGDSTHAQPEGGETEEFMRWLTCHYDLRNLPSEPEHRCPECGASDLRVYKTQPQDEDGATVRYTQCRKCACRFKVVATVSTHGIAKVTQADAGRMERAP